MLPAALNDLLKPESTARSGTRLLLAKPNLARWQALSTWNHLLP